MSLTDLISSHISKIFGVAIFRILRMFTKQMAKSVAQNLQEHAVSNQPETLNVMRLVVWTLTSILDLLCTPFWKRPSRCASMTSCGQTTISQERSADQVSSDVLNLLEYYGRHTIGSANSENSEWIGKAQFFDQVRSQIRRNDPIKMVLPAFPWKSVSNLEQ